MSGYGKEGRRERGASRRRWWGRRGENPVRHKTDPQLVATMDPSYLDLGDRLGALGAGTTPEV